MKGSEKIVEFQWVCWAEELGSMIPNGSWLWLVYLGHPVSELGGQ